MHPMNRPTVLLSGLLALNAPALAQETQPDPLPSVMVPVAVDSGEIRTAAGRARSLFTREIVAPGAEWVRLWFEAASLPAGSYLVITSTEDGAWQRLDAESVEQWGMSSAYFNGDAVTIELFGGFGDGVHRVAVSEVMAGLPSADPRSVCGSTDDRVLSYDTRVGRLSNGCTGWLIDHGGSANRFLTAGHCISSGTTGSVMFFNVPLSSSNGNFRPPAPEYQYPVQNGSIQSVNGGVGNDFATFQTHANSNTGLSPMAAQGGAFVLAADAPPASQQAVRVTGYGLRDSGAPIPWEWNRTQKTHTGPLTTSTVTTLRYRPDTTGGNSGSPVILESTGEAIGIHTHGGCGSTGGSNAGTSIEHNNLRIFLDNPQGTSIPQAALERVETVFEGGLPGAAEGAAYFDATAGSAVRVRAMELNVDAPASTEFVVRVFVTPGSAAGALGDITRWSFAGEGWGLATGEGGRTRVVLAESFALPAGATTGLAVVLDNAAHSVTPTDGPVETFGGGGVTLTAGWAADRPFESPWVGAIFNGSLLFEFEPGACPADFNADGLLNFFDVSAFGLAFQGQDTAADFNSDGLYNFFDFSAFLDAFNAGCP
jgi:V8-like Glu-specific endopeptidase